MPLFMARANDRRTDKKPSSKDGSHRYEADRVNTPNVQHTAVQITEQATVALYRQLAFNISHLAYLGLAA